MVPSTAGKSQCCDFLVGYSENSCLWVACFLPFSCSITLEKSLPIRKTSLRMRSISEPCNRGYADSAYTLAGEDMPAMMPANSADLFFIINFQLALSILTLNLLTQYSKLVVLNTSKFLA